MTTLTPVVEFEPSSYSKEGRSSPSVTGDKDPAAWHRYWKESLADSGITDLESVDNSWLVPVTDVFRSETIANLLRVEMGGQQTKTLDDIEWIRPIHGGYILRTETHTIYPACCSDLGDIESWETAAGWKKSEWEMIWIGHPWIYCMYNGSLLEFTLPSESSEELTAAFTVNPAALESAIESARGLVVAFGDRLRPELEKSVPTNLVNHVLNVLLWEKYPF